MRKSIFILVVVFWLGVFIVPPANSFTQMTMKKPLPLTQQNQATIVAIIPNSVILKQGEAVIVTADGKFLETILSALVVKEGRGVGEITVKLVQPWPASRKIELKATANAPVGPGYQLRFIGKAGLKEFKIDVPVSVFSLEVAEKKLKQIQQRTLPTNVPPVQKKQLPLANDDQEPGTSNVTPKVKEFLKFVLTAQSLEVARDEFERLNFSPSEISQIKREFESSQALQQKINEFLRQRRAEFQKRGLIFKSREDAKMKARILKLSSDDVKNRLARKMPEDLIKKLIRDCTADVPIIRGIDYSEESLQPGQWLRINGEGLGTGPGAVDLITAGKTFMVHIHSWDQCHVVGHLDPDIVGVRANPNAMISLKTNTGRETRHEIRFQPLPEYHFVDASGSLSADTVGTIVSFLLCVPYCPGNSDDWTEFDFGLKNDWQVYSTNIYSDVDDSMPGSAHAEITVSPPLNTPNCSARTEVHAGTEGCQKIHWNLYLLLMGPIGLPYR